MEGGDLCIRAELEHTLFSDKCFRFADVLFPEQELPIEVAEVDRVEINLWSIWKT